MKKFQFSLDKVLTYKEQIEENLKVELADIIQKVSSEELKLEKLENEHKSYSLEFEEEKAKGCTILKLNFYEGYLVTLTYKIKQQIAIIAKLKIKEEEKRQEVIQAQKDTKTILKLKDKKIDEHNKEKMKIEETFIEEFVATSKFMNSNR